MKSFASNLSTLRGSLLSLLLTFNFTNSAFAQILHHSRGDTIVEPQYYDSIGVESSINPGIELEAPAIHSLHFARSLLPRQSQCCGNRGCCDPGNICLPAFDRCCPVGSEMCNGWGCFTAGTACCSDGESLTATCSPGWKCTGPTTCCPNDYNVCSNRRCCAPGWKCVAGGGCCPVTSDICSNGGCCPEGTICWRSANGSIGCRGTSTGNNPSPDNTPDFPDNDAGGDEPTEPMSTRNPDLSPEPSDPTSDPPSDPPAQETTTQQVVVTTTLVETQIDVTTISFTTSIGGRVGENEDDEFEESETTGDGFEESTTVTIGVSVDESSTRTRLGFVTGVEEGRSAATTVGYSGWLVGVGMAVLGWNLVY